MLDRPEARGGGGLAFSENQDSLGMDKGQPCRAGVRAASSTEHTYMSPYLCSKQGCEAVINNTEKTETEASLRTT